MVNGALFVIDDFHVPSFLGAVLNNLRKGPTHHVAQDRRGAAAHTIRTRHNTGTEMGGGNLNQHLKIAQPLADFRVAFGGFIPGCIAHLRAIGVFANEHHGFEENRGDAWLTKVKAMIDS